MPGATKADSMTSAWGRPIPAVAARILAAPFRPLRVLQVLQVLGVVIVGVAGDDRRGPSVVGRELGIAQRAHAAANAAVAVGHAEQDLAGRPSLGGVRRAGVDRVLVFCKVGGLARL